MQFRDVLEAVFEVDLGHFTRLWVGEAFGKFIWHEADDVVDG